MNQKRLRSKLEDIICQITGVDKENITLETDLSQLGVDSFGLLTAICLIEDEYKIALPDEEIFQIKTFGELMDFVDNQVLAVQSGTLNIKSKRKGDQKV